LQAAVKFPLKNVTKIPKEKITRENNNLICICSRWFHKPLFTRKNYERISSKAVGIGLCGAGAQAILDRHSLWGK